MFCRTIHLDTGEILIGKVEHDAVPYSAYTMSIIDPVRLSPVQMQQGNSVIELFVMRKFMQTTDDEVVDVQTAKVLYMLSVRPRHEEQYEQFLALQALANERSRVAEAMGNSGLQIIDDSDEDSTTFNPFQTHHDLSEDDENLDDNDYDSYDDYTPAKPTYH